METVFSHELNRPVNAAFLDVQPAPGHWVSGVCVPVTGDDYASIRLREKNYAELDVTATTTGLAMKRGDLVFTSAGIAEHRIVDPTLEVFVMQLYIDKVNEALGLLGPTARAEFAKSTPAPTAPIVAGRYTFIDPEQAARV
jgi:hypothetical protein